jgi:hypothetical protein
MGNAQRVGRMTHGSVVVLVVLVVPLAERLVT